VTESGTPLLRAGRCLVMGVVNVTPDSFSDGGRWVDTAAAVSHGAALLDDGADMLDVGGESTRPGAGRPSVSDERDRAVPVVNGLATTGVPVSIDTTRSDVAQAALDCGASMVNDVSGGLADPRMLPMVAERAVPVVLMHWRGPSVDMQQRAQYGDVVAEVCDHLAARADAALATGIDSARIVLDPGLGFGKRAEHNWALLHRLDTLVELGFPVLVGASRKSFLGSLLATDDEDRPVNQREDATTAVTALAAAAGAWAVRVHESRASADAVRVAASWGRRS